jgi:predicted Zn finger-like uncharacterized protein
MIEIQCSSCHTRYRIDERVLPAETPTFKCSRCGHVFTADPLSTRPKPTPPPPAASKIEQPEPKVAAPKPEAAAAAPRTDTVNATRPAESKQDEPKPAPAKPYIRNQRPTIFDHKPEPASPKESVATTVSSSAATPPKAPPEDARAVPLGEAPKIETPKVFATKPPASSRPPFEDPFEHRIEKPDQRGDTGESLAFDFNDEEERELGPEESSSAAEKWSVGDEPPPPDVTGERAYRRSETDPAFSRGEPAPIGRGTIPRYAGSGSFSREAIPDDVAYVERARLHSAGFFLGLFFGVALLFVVLSLIVTGVPSASASLLRHLPVIGSQFVVPTPLESMVTISQVQATYQNVSGKHRALVVSGLAKNNSTLPLHVVQVGVHLLDPSQHEVASSAIYCSGTTISSKMISEMTPHELEFLQKLDPQKTFVLEPGHTAPFLMVFTDPPHSVSRFAVAVAKAVPAVSENRQATAK